MARPISRRRLDAVVRVHLPSLLRFAVRLTGSVHDGEDATQEALLRIARSWKSLRDEESFQSWAFQILVNLVRDRHRRNVPELVDEISVGPDEARDVVSQVADDGLTPAQISELSELREEIETKLQMLPPRQREVLALLAFEPVTPQEVAEMLEIEVSNVYATLRVARTRLKQLLAGPVRCARFHGQCQVLISM